MTCSDHCSDMVIVDRSSFRRFSVKCWLHFLSLLSLTYMHYVLLVFVIFKYALFLHRSLAPNFSKRFKSDFPRAVQRAPYGRYSRIEGHVP